MYEKIIEVQVQGDFLDRLTSARPVQALAELIWNAVDADATDVAITLQQGNLGLDAIMVADNGHGIPYDKAESIRQVGVLERRRGNGEGKNGLPRRGGAADDAVALGRASPNGTWCANLNGVKLVWIRHCLKDNPRRAIISDATGSAKTAGTGVVVRIIELHKNWKLDDEKTFQELSEIFALYLTQYPKVTIKLEGRKVDPAVLINHRETYELDPVRWKRMTRRRERATLQRSISSSGNDRASRLFCATRRASRCTCFHQGFRRPASSFPPI